jgi:hypothetical protein
MKRHTCSGYHLMVGDSLYEQIDVKLAPSKLTVKSAQRRGLHQSDKRFNSFSPEWRTLQRFPDINIEILQLPNVNVDNQS